MVDDAGPSRAGARAGRALRRALRAPPAPARAERRPQHRRASARTASSWCSSTTTSAPARAGSRRCSTRRAEHPEVDVFTGPITARLEGSRAAQLRARGAADHDARPRRAGRRRPRYAWGANMAIRRSALERVGPFDVDARARRRRAGVAGPPARAATPGARVLYVAGARRRAPPRGRRRAPARARSHRLRARPRGAALRRRAAAARPSLRARAAHARRLRRARACAAAARPG